jgi:hypothetical protein
MNALILALLLVARPHVAPVVTVGIDPLVWESTVAGADAWNDTGYVAFVPVEGCGAGRINVCLDWWEPGGHTAAAYPDGTIVVDAYDLDAYDAAVACHELGHVLGLGYHRDDGLSCMTDPDPTVAAPDAIDLANLGFVRAPRSDGTGGPRVPN